MAKTNILSQTCVKINNTYFDIVEGSFKLKKGYGSKESVKTIGEGGKIKRNVVHLTKTVNLALIKKGLKRKKTDVAVKTKKIRKQLQLQS